jgi:hypothetical protein
MRFREWLLVAERAPTPTQNVSMGPDASYGGARTMLPLSGALGGRVGASVIGGIGAARKKISADTGAEPGSVPQLGELEDMRRQPIRSIYMPLQVPADWDPDHGVLYSGKSLQNRALKVSQRPAEDQQVWRVEQNNPNSIVGAGGPSMKTRLFVYDKSAGPQSDTVSYQTAVNFTQALMKVSLASNLAPYSHLLNLDNPEIRDRQEIPIEADEQGDKMHTVMMCSFVFSPRTKDTRIGGNDWDDIYDRLQGQSSNASAAQRTPGRPSAAKPGRRGATAPVPARQPHQMARPAARTGPSAPKTGPMNP